MYPFAKIGTGPGLKRGREGIAPTKLSRDLAFLTPQRVDTMLQSSHDLHSNLHGPNPDH